MYVLSSIFVFSEVLHACITNQFGFRNDHSTNHASCLCGTIKKYLDKNYMDCGIFINLKKAFNNC